MRSIVKWLDKKYYPEFSDNWDNSLFRKKILESVDPSFNILDLGAGAGIVPQLNFKGTANKVCGVDLDERVLTNSYLDESQISSIETLPYPDESFDLVFSANVLEHIKDPLVVFKEMHRVLKPGGKALIKVPNKYHYVPLIAKVTPHWFHELINRKRGRKEADTFPTYYHANSSRSLNEISKSSGFKTVELTFFEGRPEYLRINPFLYITGITYERIVNKLSFFAFLRVIIIGVFEKP